MDREVIARAICVDLAQQDGVSDDWVPEPDWDMTWPYLDQGDTDFARIADAVLAALEASGRVIVPVEPTEGMIEEFYEWWDLGFREAYRNMLTAAKGQSDGR